MISDDDHNTIDEPTSLGFSEDVSAGFKALGWITITADNTHGDMDPFKNLLLSAFGETEKPPFIRGDCLKRKGHGRLTMEHLMKDVKQMRQLNGIIGIRSMLFLWSIVWFAEISSGLATSFFTAAHQNSTEKNHDVTCREMQIQTDYGGKLVQKWSVSDPVDATRGYSEKCLNQLVKVLPGLIGESADLASSDKVYLQGSGEFQLNSFYGRNIRYGLREHAMAAISNGIALHKSGPIPFASTFLIPADANETAGAYKVSVTNRDAPTVIALSGKRYHIDRYWFRSEGRAKKLRKEGRKVRVVSLVCWQLLNRQPRDYNEHVSLPRVSKRIGIEAGSPTKRM
ncbi:hypothetical protein D5086_015731 [Populus alba]|uniref:Uncharacterized protein n=1 Tax=Populus alba TaxID=43335 RepID=A0ACC4BS06_POPAL